jgi:PAS domain S-box-containing protein
MMAARQSSGAKQVTTMKTAAIQGGNRAVLEKEVPFQFGELFFSRTDAKGRILSGNSVFQKISQYSWDELINKPHNIIRHPDMPRAVFWLLWDTIKRGEPIGAYVKNRAKDGRYYWVFAIVTPIEGGYLSVRLKPSSPFFRVAEQEYRTLLPVEEGRKLKPAESAKMLLGRIAELGFRDYTALMSAALAQEIAVRDRELGRMPDVAIPQFEALGKAAQNLLKQAEAISDGYAMSRYIPLNLRVQAAQLGDAAATIGVISVNYSIIANDIKSLMDELVDSALKVSEAVNSGLFLFCVARLQKETVDFSRSESPSGGTVDELEMGLLEQQYGAYAERAADGLHTIAARAERFHQACAEMQKLAAGLEVTRIMANIESARLSGTHSGLNALSASLAQFQASISSGLSQIASLSRFILKNTQKLIELTEHGVHRAACQPATMLRKAS